MSKIDEIQTILENLERTCLAIHGSYDDIDIIDKDMTRLLDQTKSELRKVIEKCVPEKKKEAVNYDTYDRDAVIYNLCRTQTLKNIGELFNNA